MITVVNLLLGRGSGGAWPADPVCQALLTSFTPAEARIALTTYTDVEIASKLQMAKPVEKYAELLVLLQPKFTDLQLGTCCQSCRRSPARGTRCPSTRN